MHDCVGSLKDRTLKSYVGILVHSLSLLFTRLVRNMYIYSVHKEFTGSYAAMEEGGKGGGEGEGGRASEVHLWLK